MKLTDEQARRIGQSAGVSESFAATYGRAAFEESMRIALAAPSDDEACEVVDKAGFRYCYFEMAKKIIEVFLANRIASYYEPQDRTVPRLQKWFETHGHPEFCMDPQPLEQLAAIVIEEYEKRKKDPRLDTTAYGVAESLGGGRR